MIDRDTIDRLSHDGWAAFEMDCGEDIREQLDEECREARSAADDLLDIHSRLGLPEEVIYGTEIPTPGYPTTEELQIFQAQRKISPEKFTRISTEMTLADYPTPRFDGDPSGIHPAADRARKLTLTAAQTALAFFGLEGYEVPRRDDNPDEFHRLQFIHTQYRPGGFLFGSGGRSRGHSDTPYRGVTISRNINADSEAEWTIDNGKGRRKFTQTGNLVVAMTGKHNPYHLVEVHRKASERRAALLRLTGKPLQQFLSE